MLSSSRRLNKQEITSRKKSVAYDNIAECNDFVLPSPMKENSVTWELGSPAAGADPEEGTPGLISSNLLFQKMRKFDPSRVQ